MKKILVLLMCLVLAMGAFTACGKKDAKTNVDTGTKAKVKTGLAVITSAGSSKDAGDADGLAQADSTAAAVIVDEKGVIVDCVIDVVQTKIKFSKTGEITTDSAAEFVSKHELGDAYKMKEASPIKKEWYEQATALQEYVIGKTLDEVKGIAIDEKGTPTSADLTSSVTMKVGSMLEAVEKAVTNAESLGATAGDKLGLGIISKLGHSTKNAADGDGVAQAYTHYGVVTLGADGKITSSIIDASQANISFSKEGKITSDLAATFQTKNELGEGYNMKGASSISKEWNEQAKAFADYIVGKTVGEVTGIALNESGVPTSTDLTSSVTVSIGDFLTVIEKACTTAK
ncbi:hypothetical protein [Lachnoclostridium sp.]|nr:hypothetical protein [Lachnoclostridium sp.]